MKDVVTKRVIHRGESRIAVRFSYNEELACKVREIPGSKWSMTMKCWHLPDNKETFLKMMSVFGNILSIDTILIQEYLKEENGLKDEDERRAQFQDANQSSSFHGQEEKHEEKDIGQNFQASSSSTGMRTERIVRRSEFDPVEFSINETDGQLVIRFKGRYSREWIRELKSYGRVWFDPVMLEWHMGWTKMKVDSLSDFFASKGIEVEVKRAKLSLPLREQRHEKSTIIRDRDLSDKVREGLEVVRKHLNEKRYSINTIISLMAHIQSVQFH